MYKGKKIILYAFASLDLKRSVKRLEDQALNSNFYDSISDGKVLVKLEASWCGPCKAYAPTFKEFSEENDSVKCYSLDCQVAPEIAEDFDVKSIPVTILFNNGEMIAKKPGKLSKDQLLDFIDQDF